MPKFSRLVAATRGLPIAAWLVGYDRRWWHTDVAAGLTVCALLIPSGMAHSELAGMAPTAGLYGALAALVIYAVLGTARRLSVGTEATTALLTAAILAPMVAEQGAGRYPALAATLALCVGAICALAGAARLGWVAAFLSRPIMAGYLVGAGLTVIGSQLPKLFGVPSSGTDFAGQVGGLMATLPGLHPLTTAIGAATLAYLFAMRRFVPRVPAALIALVVTIAASAAFDLAGRGVAVVGTVTGGLPALAWPAFGLGDVLGLLGGALSLSLLIFVSSILTAQGLAGPGEPPVDANRELVALGAMNAGAAWCQGFPVAGSDSRSALNAAAGARSQVSGLVAAAGLLLFLAFLAPVIRFLPTVVLAAVLVQAAVGLLHPKETLRLFNLRWAEGGLALVTVVGVLLLGVVPGIALAVILSLLELIGRLARPHDAVLADLGDAEGYHPIRKGGPLQTVPGLVVYRFDAPLFFANSPYFLARATEVAELARPKVRWFVLDAEAIATADATALAALDTLEAELSGHGAVLALARPNQPLRALLRRTSLGERLAPRTYPSVRAAIAAFDAEAGAPAVTWAPKAPSEADEARER